MTGEILLMQTQRKNPRFAEKTQQIEKLLGRELKEVTCSDCHGKDHKELHMPTPATCGECHLNKQQNLCQAPSVVVLTTLKVWRRM